MKSAKFMKSKKIIRPSKDEYYLDLAKSVCRRATCLKVEIGAVIIKDDQVVATGYCGSPRGTKVRLNMDFVCGKNSEFRPVIDMKCAEVFMRSKTRLLTRLGQGVSLLGGDMYIYGKTRNEDGSEGGVIDAFPCFICKKMLINCGLKRVICSLERRRCENF